MKKSLSFFFRDEGLLRTRCAQSDRLRKHKNSFCFKRPEQERLQV
ncbi:hypothetical protein [Treponema sp. UBA3813]|nr:hypothetical protein [Treponema sp. UBA3813]